MIKYDQITFEDEYKYSRLENVTVHCEMEIDVPVLSNLQEFTEFLQSVNRVKQYTYDVIGSLIDDKHTVDFSKVSMGNIQHNADLNYLFFSKIHRGNKNNDELTYLLSTYINDVFSQCYLIFTISY